MGDGLQAQPDVSFTGTSGGRYKRSHEKPSSGLSHAPAASPSTPALPVSSFYRVALGDRTPSSCSVYAQTLPTGSRWNCNSIWRLGDETLHGLHLRVMFRACRQTHLALDYQVLPRPRSLSASYCRVVRSSSICLVLRGFPSAFLVGV